jgi:ABC-type dipeptide/oligopeptide/nickel transport system permease subunit
MKTARYCAALLLLLVAIAGLGASWLAPADYATQFREVPNAAPSRSHLLGTDALGRDRFSRLLYGTRISLVLAPAAALLATLAASLVGVFAGCTGGLVRNGTLAAIDLFLSLPWLFLLITVRALLPLNASGMTSAVVTFLILGLLGWAGSARILCAGVVSILSSEFVLQARSCGVPRFRLLLRHVLPNLFPTILAQFWISIPIFILAEANLGLLGLGVSEPLPSWGSLLRELQDFAAYPAQPWKLAPLVLLVVVVTSFQLVLSSNEVMQ